MKMEFEDIGRDLTVIEMRGWVARDRQNFVRDTNDGHRVNVYWCCGGTWLIQVGHIERDGDWTHFIGRQGRRVRGWSGWKQLKTARFHADWFASLHGDWVGIVSVDVSN